MQEDSLGLGRAIAQMPMSFDFQPNRRRVRSAGLSAASAGLSVLGIEVTQTVQDMQNSVTLVANKLTVVRVYLDATSLAGARWISGEIAWHRGSGAESYLPAINRVRLRPDHALTLTAQRHDLEASLNFMLPTEAIAAGSLTLRLNRLYIPGGDDVPSAGVVTVTVEFEQMPPLVVRAVGMRYFDNATNEFVSPSAIHFAYLRSFLQRAYPVAELIWSQIVNDASFSAPFPIGVSIQANGDLAAMRSLDMSAGGDPRTHYYGLVSDNRGRRFLRGRAFTIPSQPRPDTVAVGPVGHPANFPLTAWDTDPSYGDWYGAHEIAHTFGRFHPGFPPLPQPGGQDASDANFPYPGGQLSADDDRYVGFDVGDATLGLPMRPLPGRTHHDVMTYLELQWLSAYTYEAIRQRLLAEAALNLGMAVPAAIPALPAL